MYKILLSLIILTSNTVLAMDGMHNHDSHNHNKHQDMTYVDGSKTKITDEMFSSFSAGLSNTQIVIVDVQGMVCDFCARGIEKTFNDDKDVKKVDVSLDKGKVMIAYSMNKEVDLDEIKNIFLSNGQTATGIVIRKV
jgi:copper chaperone CopZ